MKTTLTIGILLLGILSFSAQELPECIEKLSQRENSKYEGTLLLPNNETVYKITIIRPPKCMDCLSGVVFRDSLCNIAASFTVGIAPKKFVKGGYEESWFRAKPKNKDKKVSDPLEKQKNYEKSKAYFEHFQKPVKYKVKSVNKQKNPLQLLQNDIIEVSLQNGMILYPKNKKQNQYKLMPEIKEFSHQPNCIKQPCPPDKETKSYFRWEDYGIIFNDNSISLFNFNDKTGSAPIINKLNQLYWENLYEIEKIK